MLIRVLILVLLIAGPVIAQEPVSWESMQAGISSWPEGPVSLIMTGEEIDVFKKLKTSEEQMQFIKIFWARRDTVLRTRINEFKEEFYKRVEYADANFAEKNRAGWKTAQGQVYVLFGKPSRIDHQSIPESSRPALLWVYDKILSNRIPTNEALMFVWRDFKYVLAPPSPEPGDTIGRAQQSLDSAFRYEDVPSLVQQAFVDVAKTAVFDEKKNYNELLTSVKSTEKFGIKEIGFDLRTLESHPVQIQAVIPVESAPVYDDGQKVFAEFFVSQELMQGGVVAMKKETSSSFTWTQEEFDKMKEIVIGLPALSPGSGSYELSVTVQDRISGVSETRKTNVSY